jgi:hypothetical protein
MPCNLRLVTSTTAANPNSHDLYLDDSGQLELVGSDITDVDSYTIAVAQRIKTRLLMVRGEWYLDQRVGTPLRERVWLKGATAASIKRTLREVTESTPGVLSVESIEVSLNAAARTATATIQARTDLQTIATIEILDQPLVIDVRGDR